MDSAAALNNYFCAYVRWSDGVSGSDQNQDWIQIQIPEKPRLRREGDELKTMYWILFKKI